LTNAGLVATAAGNTIEVTHGAHKFKCEVDAEWIKVVNAYFKAKQYSFDDARHTFSGYKAIEIQLVRLSPVFAVRTEYEYKDTFDARLRIATASPEFCLAYITSGSALKPLDLVKRRLEARAEHGTVRPDGTIKLYKLADLLAQPYTAQYTVTRKIAQDKLSVRANAAAKSALFKLAHTTGDCWELRESVRLPSQSLASKPAPADDRIPNIAYNDDLVKYYKVAKSSIFPNQQFLSYYHVLEYFFLRVSDEVLHTSVKGVLNSPTFNSSYENVSKLIASLKKHDSSSDETEMLKAVLSKYVDEDDLIEFIQEIEKGAGDRVYSDTKKKVFGQQASISLQKGHALFATGRAIKLIRNALVHSSDKYNREDCFLPLTESESTVIQYIPLVRFLAERVIYSTASGA
jgi:hypothetical protein